jgi:hypothetical protein
MTFVNLVLFFCYSIVATYCVWMVDPYVGKLIIYLFIAVSGFLFFFLSFFRSLTMHNLCYNNLFGAPIYCYLLHFIFQNLNGTMIQSSNFIHLMFLGLNWYFDKMLGYDTPCHFFILLKTLFYSFCRMNKLF